MPLLIGITGSSSSGKTFSAMRLAEGIRQVAGGEIFFIDTEGGRANHYADLFRFQYVPMPAPFGPLDYLDAIEYCVKQGATTIVIDSMTHEHSGEGGVMDQSEKFLDKKCGDDTQAREKNLMSSLVGPKKQRKQLNARIVQLGINLILCYRASDKVKPVRGQGIQHIGWQPETTSDLFYDMTARFLLEPGSDGKPTINPETMAEKLLTKSPQQFRDWFKPGMQLSEDIGKKLAEWAAGDGKVSENVERKRLGETCIAMINALPTEAKSAAQAYIRTTFGGRGFKELDIEQLTILHGWLTTPATSAKEPPAAQDEVLDDPFSDPVCQKCSEPVVTGETLCRSCRAEASA